MTALLAGDARGFARGASDLRSSSRAHLRRGLVGSALLHLVLLAVVLHATGGGEAIVRTYFRPTEVFTLRPNPPQLPQVEPVVSLPAQTQTPDDGVIEPVVTRPPIQFDPVDASGPARTPVADDPPGSPPNGRDFAPPPSEDPPLGIYRPVDELPVPVFAPKPEYPSWAREAGVTGRVLLNVLVGTDGRVRRIVIERDENGLGKEASEKLLKWVFRPARVNGAAVATWVAVPVVFRL